MLIETGFLTNPQEEDYLHTESGKDDIALSIFLAFENYKKEIEEIEKESEVNDNVINTDLEEFSEEFHNNEIYYKIQLGIFLESMLNSNLFDGVNVIEYVSNGTYKYLVPASSDKKYADRLKMKYRSGKFPGAFIIAFHKDKQISVKEALDLQNKLNYE